MKELAKSDGRAVDLASVFDASPNPHGLLWSLADQTRPRLELMGRAIGGPVVVPPGRKGFGSRLIERNVRHDLAGEDELAYAHGGFTATFSLPLNREQGA